MLIYVPGVDPESAEPAAALEHGGLTALLPSQELPCRLPVARGCGRGPDESFGAVLGYTDPELTNHEAQHALAFLGYIPAAQEWTKATVGGHILWFGRQHGKRTKPAALRRETDFVGEALKLDDGQLWEVPLVFRLPSEIHYSASEARQEYLPAFRPLVETAQRVHAVCVAAHLGQDSEDPLTVKDFWTFSADVLAMNYCLTREMVEFLGLLRREETVLAVCCAAIERPGAAEWNRAEYAEPPDQAALTEAAGATS